MKKRILIAAGAIALLGACGPGDNFRDVEGVRSQKPDLIEVYSNVDQHPNIVKVCIDHVAFATTSRDYQALTRIQEWDRTCPGAK